MGAVEPKCAPVKLNVRQRRRKAMHELHTMKFITARLVGASSFDLGLFGGIKSRDIIHQLQKIINKLTRKS